MNSERLQQILERASQQRLLVIGDLMLDEFVWGKVGRISPEAPVPVVEVSGESFYPGGAANVARNLREFTGNVAVVGMIGRDRGGDQLRQLLADQKIDTSACSDRSRIFPPSSRPASLRGSSSWFGSTGRRFWRQMKGRSSRLLLA